MHFCNVAFPFLLVMPCKTIQASTIVMFCPSNVSAVSQQGQCAAGKLQRLEEERQAHVEQLDAQDATLEDVDRHSRALQAQADTALQNLREVSDDQHTPVNADRFT